MMYEIKHRNTGTVLHAFGDTAKACAEDATKNSANLRDADLRDADLRGADLRGAKLNWMSHDLISAILWDKADTVDRQMLAAFIGKKIIWCWNDFSSFVHPEREWAIGVLKTFVTPDDGADDGAPDLLT